MLLVGEENGLTAEQAHRLHALAPSVDSMARELAAFGIPETVQHDDLHSNNVLVRNGRTLVFDWGDSSVSHPFLSLLVLLRGAARDLKAEPESNIVRAVRAAYLGAWSLPLSESDLNRACILADALGRISRALTWHRLAAGLEPAYRAEHRTYVTGWLEELLESPAVLGR